jgi:hypothetical protein
MKKIAALQMLVNTIDPDHIKDDIWAWYGIS